MRHSTSTYAEGVPTEIDPNAFSSVPDIFDKAVKSFPTLTAYECFGQPLSYADLDQKSRAFAAYLQTEVGLKKGDRVALMMPNIFVFPIAMLGIMRAGGVQVNVNPMYTPRELAHQLSDSGAEVIIIFGGSTPVLAECLSETPIRTIITADLGDGIGMPIPTPPVDSRLPGTKRFSDALLAGETVEFSPVSLNGDDLLFLQYTGGTTGLSKGATLSHRNLIANMEQYKAFMPEALSPGEEVVVGALPMYHIFGLMLNLAYLSIGSRIILIPNPRDMDSFVAAIRDAKISIMAGVNTLFAGMLMHPKFDEIDFSHQKISIGGGAAVLESTSDKWYARTGQHIKEGYGLSETSPIVSIVPMSVGNFTGACGLPVPSTEIQLLKDDDSEAEIGEAGEICVLGPQVMQGYWNRPDANNEVFTKDGYFRTGDIGVFDEAGFLRIVDRKKDMIVVSGFNVYPNEVEAVASTFPEIVECASIGIPSEKTGEAVALYAVLIEGAECSAEDVVQHCRQSLTAYKVPHQIHFVEELPKSNVGKILRRELRALIKG